MFVTACKSPHVKSLADRSSRRNRCGGRRRACAGGKMMTNRFTSGRARGRVPRRALSRRGRGAAGFACLALGSALLAGCGSSSSGAAGAGPVTLNFYQFPDVSGATNTEIKNCNAQSHGEYKISYQLLPAASDAQRLQLVRRLAAHDIIDRHHGPRRHLGGRVRQRRLDRAVDRRRQGPGRVNGTIAPALQTAMWKGQLVAVPDNSNTQLLWYRSDLVPTPPTTWAQMIADAEQLAKEGKPHYIEIQGAQYEGATVWFNTMVASAGGTILNPAATKVTLGAAAVKAPDDHEAARPLGRRGPVAGRADGEPEPAGDGRRHGRLRAELPVRLSVHEVRQPEAVQGLQVGALPGGRSRRAGQGDDRRHRPRGQRATRSTRRSPSRPRCACGTRRTS